MNKYQEMDAVIDRTAGITYRAAIIDKPGSIDFIELPIPEPNAGEVLIKVEGCGMCASTIPLWEGREWFNYPLEPGAPGHEGWGTVEQIGEGSDPLLIGRRVAFLGGNALAEYATVPASDCVPLPDSLDNTPFPGEPFGCLMNIIDRSDIQKGQTVAVIGQGFLGLGVVKLAKEMGARVIALSRRDSSLSMAAEHADLCLKMDDHWQIVEKIKEYTHGNGCERVIECTGKQWPLDLAGDIIGEYGKMIIAGYHQDGLRTVNMQNWNWKAIDVINAHERDPKRYREGIIKAVEAVKNGQLQPEALLTHEFSFENLQKAFEILVNCPEGFVKGYINFK